VFRISRHTAIFLLAALTLMSATDIPAGGAPQGTPPAKSEKLPRPVSLEGGMKLERDPASGELRPTTRDAPPALSDGAIRSHVTLVQVPCTVTAPDGTQVRGLTRDNFRLLEDGAEQQIDSFDAAETPASIALILDASPSIYRQLGQMREVARSLSASLGAQDAVAVLAFSDQTHLLLPFSTDRALLAAALASPELARVADSSQSLIYQAVYLTARELFPDRAGRKAIVLLTDGQDSGLGLTWDPASMHASPQAANHLAFDDVARELASSGVELYVISTENRPSAMTDAWLAAHQRMPLLTAEAQRLGMPHYTLYLAELVRQAGGGLYFMRELGGLQEIYHRIALKLGAEYTLGYYPTTDSTPNDAGWHQLKVEIVGQADASVIHRAAYYVSSQ